MVGNFMEGLSVAGDGVGGVRPDFWWREVVERVVEEVELDRVAGGGFLWW